MGVVVLAAPKVQCVFQNSNMKKNLLLIAVLLIGLFTNCTDGDKAIETVLEEVERGAVLRTSLLRNDEFVTSDLSSGVTIVLEEMDVEDGALLESVDVWLEFKDRTPENGTDHIPEKRIEIIEKGRFESSVNGLPQLSYSLNFQEALEALSLSVGQVHCTDEFVLRFDLGLSDGRRFSTANSSSLIIGSYTFFSSPFTYSIPVVESISPDLFTGTYIIESILDGPNGPTFVESDIVEIEVGRSASTRQFLAYHNLYHRGLEEKRLWDFKIACDQTFFGRYQLSSPEGSCRFNAAPLLLGPDVVNAVINPDDDSVFELWFVEGYLGYDGGCDFTTAPSRYRFSKQ
jgi:hypothetical protein